MIVYSDVDSDSIYSHIETLSVHSSVIQNTVHSEELEWNDMLHLRITENSEYRTTEDNSYRELG